MSEPSSSSSQPLCFTHIVPPPAKRRRTHVYGSSRTSSHTRTTQVVRISRSSTGRLRQKRTYRETARVVDADVEVERWTADGAANHVDDGGSGQGQAESATGEHQVKRPKGLARTTKLIKFLALRNTFLDELLRHDGHGDSFGSSTCYSCGSADGTMKCVDCYSQRLRCQACIVDAHRELPLHRIQEWNGQFFNKTSLQKLGLRYQLGHGGARCPLPTAGPIDFVLFDTSGVHFVSIDYCNCGHQGHTFERWQQLLRTRWFPASFSRPRTVFTFNLLEMFHELTLQGKTTQYDFYNSILRIYDNSRLSKAVYKYTEFIDVVRFWRNVMLLKRGGRGQHPAGANGTREGELAVECPACPHPGRNLPNGWENEPPEERWKYTLFRSYDACFKLGLKDRGLNDVELAPGWSYYVEEAKYQHHIRTHPNATELSTCKSNHDAILRANTRHKEGYLASGQGLGLCARHAVVGSNAVGDLQLGEQYRNMDYIILSSLIAIGLLRIIITYDIACQWSRNFHKRVPEYPEHMQLDLERVEVRPAVPDFHIRAHGTDCQQVFALAFLLHSGRTIGEEVETGWAHMGLAASSIQEMRPANRRETLDDHWGGWNYQKTLTFRKLFLKRLKTAQEARIKHKQLHEEFTATFKSPATIPRWEAHAAAWDADENVPNPYEEPVNKTTERDVRLMLAKEEEENAAKGQLPPHKMTPSAFIAYGLDLEEAQRSLRLHISLSGELTRTQQTLVHERRVALMRQVSGWRQAQLIYMPCVSTLLPTSTTPDFDAPRPKAPPTSECIENTPLWLPSGLPDSLSRPLRATMTPGLLDKEKSLRLAQAEDALEEIRRLRRVVTGLVIFKKLNVSGTGQKRNTRMRTLFKRFGNSTKRAAACYRDAYDALTKLDPSGDWSSRLRVLRDEDIRGPAKEDRDDKFDNRPETSDRRREQSWIWLVHRASNDDSTGGEEHLDANLRVEWMKSRARFLRWDEEVVLIVEEMRRTLAYFEYKAAWWHARKHLRDSSAPPDICHGVNAYAEKQAFLLHCRTGQYSRHWLPHLASQGATPSWCEPYLCHLKVGAEASSTEDIHDDDDDRDDDEEDLEHNDAGGNQNTGRHVDEYEIDF